MSPKKVILHPGKEKAILQKHHWIFSGAIQSLPSFKNGDFLPVFTSDDRFLGSGYFNRKSGITGRMLAFDETPPKECLERKLKAALIFRDQWFDKNKTNSFRLINGEGDGIPGLVIDLYDRTAVLQSSTLGIDRAKQWIVDWLIKEISPVSIYEKSLSPARKEEGVEEAQGFLYGEKKNDIFFKENEFSFTAKLDSSQKTGFFLDHREMRKWIGELALNKTVLNAFCYTGGFSVYALAGGALSVDSVDISKEAIEAAKEHAAMNGVEHCKQEYICADVFDFLRENPLNYQLVILDPPAFAKKKKDIIAACRGYKEINRMAMKKMPKNSFLLTCSCSYHVNEELFQKVIFQSALEAGRNVRIVGSHRLAADHPINIYHPESHYLKSFLLYLE